MSPRADPGQFRALLDDDRWFRGLARNLLVSGPDVDDVLQEARLAALEHPPPLVKDPRSWMAKVAFNFAKKLRRGEGRRKRRERLAARPERLCATPEDALARAELRHHVLEAVLGLSEPCRSTAILRFLEEMSLREIADSQRLSLNTVKTRVSRALALLRQRLNDRYGGRAAWSALLAPLPFSTASNSSLGAVAGIGILSMSMKSIAIALSVSVFAVLVGLGVVLLDRDRAASTRSPQMRADLAPVGAPLVVPAAAPAPGQASSQEEPAVAPRPIASVPDAGPAPRSAVAPEGTSPPRVEAESAEVLRAREALRALRKLFGEGGRDGWKGVGQNIAALQELLLRSEDELAGLLALFDEEKDASFLEAVMHHLPLTDSEHRPAVLAHTELHDEIWNRYENEESPDRRRAFLRFFAYNRKLSASRMGAFVELARSEAARQVRQLALDAVASNTDLIPDTWEALADAAEEDADPECRRTALSGLGYAESERAAALVRAAFSSGDEETRAALLRSTAGERIPEELTRGDATAYLLGEFRAARTRAYKEALIERLLDRAPEALEEAIRSALPEEPDWGLKRAYREALRRVDELRPRKRG